MLYIFGLARLFAEKLRFSEAAPPFFCGCAAVCTRSIWRRRSRKNYLVLTEKQSGARIVRVYCLVAEFGIRPPDTIEFQAPKIDLDGVLLLDLRTISISPKAHSQCRRNDWSAGIMPTNAGFSGVTVVVLTA